MNGIELLKEIKKIKKNIIVIINTSSKDKKLKEMALKYGAYKFYNKCNYPYLKKDILLININNSAVHQNRVAVF
jgi:DNA-binding NtrC family response regulator